MSTSMPTNLNAPSQLQLIIAFELTVSSPNVQVILGGGLPWNRQRRVAEPPSDAATSGSGGGIAIGAAGTSTNIVYISFVESASSS